MPFAIEERALDNAGNIVEAAKIQTRAILKTPEELVDIVTQFAAADRWLDRVRLRVDQRWYERQYHGPDYDIWAISWMPGQSTGFHDHGESSGAFVVTTGTLEEHRPGEPALEIHSGQPRAFGTDYLHDVRNASLAPAVSIHAYSPPLSEMNEYELEGDQLLPRESVSERARALGVRAVEVHTLEQDSQTQKKVPTDSPTPRSIEEMLSAARARLQRLSPSEAHAAANQGAVLVDIRPEGQRAIEGGIPGALIVERNVLEWRFDPTSSARLPVAADHDLQVIVICSEGYTSSLAAAVLQDLGIWRATDVIGGFHSWCVAGLPIVPTDKPS